MSQTFTYDVVRIKDLKVNTRIDNAGKSHVDTIEMNDELVKPTPRFWNSLHVRFGFTSNIFRYFNHAEVFDRISSVNPNDEVRCCLERNEKGLPNMLAVTTPGSGYINHDDLMDLLNTSGNTGVRYHNGIVTSEHEPRLNPVFQVAGDGFRNKYVLDTPIDGYGKPAVYLSMLRLICSNGAIGYSPTFRSELGVGKGENGVRFTLERVMEGFNNEDGYNAMRQRFESSTKSWASVHEANRLYKVLTRMHGRGEIKTAKTTVRSIDGEALVQSSPLYHSFHKMTGDLSRIYGLASMDALSARRQRTLPTACKVYDLLNFASEVATHHANEAGNKTMQAFIGELISDEYDLEGTVEQFGDWRDFFISSEAANETKAKASRRSR